MKSHRSVPLLMMSSLLAVALTACGDGGSDAVGGYQGSPGGVVSSGPVGDSADDEPQALPPVKVGPVTLAVSRHVFAREKTDLVDIPGGTFDILLVNGKTAYRFEEDEDKPSKVNCADDCLITWPPVVVDSAGVTSSDGVNSDLIGTVKRADGHLQVTYNGWPLYWFFKDEAPGDAKGEGLGGNWSTVTADGKPVFKKTVPSPSAS